MIFNSETQPRKQLRMAGFDYRMPGYYFVTICTNQRECLFGEISDNEMRLNAAGQMVEHACRAIPEQYSGWDLDCLIVMPNHIHAVLVLSEAIAGSAGDRPTRFEPTGISPTKTGVKPIGVGPDGAGASGIGEAKAGSAGVEPIGVWPTEVRPIDVKSTDVRPIDVRPTGVGPTNVNPTGVGPARGPAPTEATSQNKVPTLSLPALIRNLKSYTMTCYRHGVYSKNWPAFHQTLWQRSYHEHVVRNESSLNKIRHYISNNPAQWTLDSENPSNVSYAEVPLYFAM